MAEEQEQEGDEGGEGSWYRKALLLQVLPGPLLSVRAEPRRIRKPAWVPTIRATSVTQTLLWTVSVLQLLL